jgi:hypothetical protein
MDFRSAHLKRPPVLAAAVFVAVFSAQVRYAPLRAGQPIWFSAPRNDTVSSNVPTLLPKPLESLDFGSSAQISLPFDLNGPLVDAPPPPVALTISPAEQAQLQDVSDRRKNWMLLTPAEILGATTPEKILGIKEHDAVGQPRNLTALERYTERQSQMLPAHTNAFQNGDSSPSWDFSRNRRDPSEGFNPINGGLKNPAFLENAPLNSGPDNRTLAGQNQNGDQSKLFDSPTPLPVPNAAQQLSLERFRLLLGASPSPAPAAIPSSNDKIFSLPEMSPDVKLDQPLLNLNPAGASFATLNSSIGKPPSLPALPSYWGLSYTSSRPAAAWVPQPPPWTSPDQQPFAVPQRKF